MAHEAVTGRGAERGAAQVQHCSQKAACLPKPIPYREGTVGIW